MTIATTEHVRRLPKVELHCHIEGAGRAATIAELADSSEPNTAWGPEPEQERARVADLAGHNLKRLLDAGLKVTINSDDPAYFGATWPTTTWLPRRLWA